MSLRHKTCSKCGETKPLDAYHRRGDGRGVRPHCKSCRSKSAARLRSTQKPTQKAVPQCADCQTKLTPNRTVTLCGEGLCLICHAKRFQR